MCPTGGLGLDAHGLNLSGMLAGATLCCSAAPICLAPVRHVPGPALPSKVPQASGQWSSPSGGQELLC